MSTEAACGANISGEYTAHPPLRVPELATLALLDLTVVGAGVARGKFAESRSKRGTSAAHREPAWTMRWQRHPEGETRKSRVITHAALSFLTTRIVRALRACEHLTA